MSNQDVKQTLLQTLKNEGMVSDSRCKFRQFLRSKDGNEDEEEDELGSFEARFEFASVEDLKAEPAKLVAKYF